MNLVEASARTFVFAGGELVDSYREPTEVSAAEVRAGDVVHMPLSDDRRVHVEWVESGTDSQNRPRVWLHYSDGVYGTSPDSPVLVSPDPVTVALTTRYDS